MMKDDDADDDDDDDDNDNDKETKRNLCLFCTSVSSNFISFKCLLKIPPK